VPEVLRFPSFTGLPLDVLVTTRDGGVSEGPYGSLNLGLHVGDDPARVVENRRRAAALVGAELDDLVVAGQEHTHHVEVVGTADRGRGARTLDDVVPATDALVTEAVGPVLVTMVADCVPLVLYDPEAHVLAGVHAGWKGTTGRIAAATVQAMVGMGATPERLVVGIGPAIGADVYQVGPEVRDAAVAALGSQADVAVRPDPSTPDRWLFDLHAANRLVLHDVGVADDRIDVLATSTQVDGRLFSDRAERPCGRFALLARLLDR
jgi:hypothetical protein